MTFETDSDRRAMLEDFGFEVILNGVPVTIIFDNGYADANGSWVTIPIITAVENDFENANAAVGDIINIENVDYSIAESPQPDGFGIINVILQKQ